MRRADWLTILLGVGLGMGSLALVVAAFFTDGNAANLLIAIGVGLAIACLILVVQVVHSVATRAKEIETAAGHDPPVLQEARPTEVAAGAALLEGGPAQGSAPVPTAGRSVDVPIVAFRAASAAPSSTELISQARREVLAMVVSGRNFMQPQLHHVILEKMRDPNDQTVVRLLALNHYSASEFVEARANMMDMSRRPEFWPVYEQDFHAVREYTSQITIEDPTRSRFDVRFYDRLPTTYFYIIDGTLYLGSLLSKPVSSSPFFVIGPISEETRAIISAYRSHFEHYWSSARFFVTLIGLTDDGRTVLVRNAKRALEWPTGYIEPNEDLAVAAVREFQEETGYSAGPARQIAATDMGYFFVSKVGQRVAQASAREVTEVRLVSRLPDKNEMSFPKDYSRFLDFYEQAKLELPSLSRP